MTDGVAEAPVFPDAVWACVARFCGPRTLRALACTCRQVRGVCAAEHALRTRALCWDADAAFGEWLSRLRPIEHAEPLCQCALVGPHGAGKTALIDAYQALDGDADGLTAECPAPARDQPATVYPTRRICATRIFGQQMPFVVWDTPANERFCELCEAYLLQAHTIFFVLPYDSDTAAVERALEWLEPWCAVAHTVLAGEGRDRNNLVLVVSKCDLAVNHVSNAFRTAVAQFCRRHELCTAYVSVRCGDSVRELFRYGAMRSLQWRYTRDPTLPQPSPPPRSRSSSASPSVNRKRSSGSNSGKTRARRNSVMRSKAQPARPNGSSNGNGGSSSGNTGNGDGDGQCRMM